VHGIRWARGDHPGVFVDAGDQIDTDAITGLFFDQLNHFLSVGMRHFLKKRPTICQAAKRKI
jgi:hypothetical protein